MSGSHVWSIAASNPGFISWWTAPFSRPDVESRKKSTKKVLKTALKVGQPNCPQAKIHICFFVRRLNVCYDWVWCSDWRFPIFIDLRGFCQKKRTIISFYLHEQINHCSCAGSLLLSSKSELPFFWNMLTLHSVFIHPISFCFVRICSTITSHESRPKVFMGIVHWCDTWISLSPFHRKF